MFTSDDPRRWMHGPIKKEVKRTVEELFREGAEQARDFLFNLLTDPKASSRDRYAAATEILNRGFGKPVDRQVVANLEGNKTSGEVNKLTGAELDSRIYQALQLDGATIHDNGAQVIEHQAQRPDDTD